jgi:hypothetical protein
MLSGVFIESQKLFPINAPQVFSAVRTRELSGGKRLLRQNQTLLDKL